MNFVNHQLPLEMLSISFLSISVRIILLLMIRRNVTGQSELVGVSQPFSIFVDQLIPLPGGGKYGKLMFFIDILMWLKDEDQLAVVCPHLKKVSDPTVQNALREVGNSMQTSPSSCPSFEQRMECK